MKILVLNCGSSTIKFNLYDLELSRLLTGFVDKIGFSDTSFKYQDKDGTEFRDVRPIEDHRVALDIVLNTLTEKFSVNKSEIKYVGHRVVHGGEKLSAPCIVDETVKQEIKRCFSLAPLHNPHHMSGILAIEHHLPHAVNVTVFDTAFHLNMPEHAYLYGLPYNLYKKHNIRKFGFHGISHQYIAEKTAELLEKPLGRLKIISCHLGNGCSITAVKYGKSVDTSMGFTPLEGLIMGTRCGDIDPAIVTWIMMNEGLNLNDVDILMNKQSGLYGISGISNDMRTIIEEAYKKNHRAILAIEMFCYRIRKYIGSYYAALNKPDALVFTAGVGENSSLIREKACKGLENMGIVLDKSLNKKNKPGLISGKKGSVAVLALHTDEELMIAKQTLLTVGVTRK